MQSVTGKDGWTPKVIADEARYVRSVVSKNNNEKFSGRKNCSAQAINSHLEIKIPGSGGRVKERRTQNWRCG